MNISKKNIIIGVVVIVIISAAGAFYFTATSPASDDQAQVKPPDLQMSQSASTPTASPAVIKAGAKIKTANTVWTHAIESPSGSAPSVGLYITTQKLIEATGGQSYNAFISAFVAPTKNLEWKILSGSLAPGLVATHSIDCASVEGKVCQPSLQIAGVPQAAGSYPFRAAVSDGTIAVYKDFTLVVKVAPNLTITTASLPAGVLGENYTAEIAGSGGASSYSWNVRTGYLPAGLSLVASGCTDTTVCKASAKIIGKTGSAGTFTFGVVLTSGDDTTSKEFTIVVK